MESALTSRRRALAFLLGGSGLLPRLLPGTPATEAVRIAISESLVADVNMNDARAAITIWLKQLARDLKYDIEYSPKVFDTTDEIISRARNGRLDAVSLNILEYRQIADYLDPSQVVAPSPGQGPDRYMLLAKRGSGFGQLAQLRGRRLSMLKAPKTCVAPAWIANVLEAAHLGPADYFFASITMETKMARVVLPVFFGQTDACITTKASFDIMCEMNPQVGKSLEVLAMSAPMVVAFYMFHKSFHSAARKDFMRVLTEFHNNAAARQLATLFQFDELTVLDARSLDSALKELEMADRARGKSGTVVKGAQ